MQAYLYGGCAYLCACERRGDAHSCFMPESLHMMVRAGLRQQQSDFSCWRSSSSQLAHCASRLGRKDSPVTEGLMWCQGSVALFISNSTELGGVFKREECLRVSSGSWICARMLGFLALNLDLCIVSQPLPASLCSAWHWASLSPWALQGEMEKHFGSVSEIQWGFFPRLSLSLEEAAFSLVVLRDCSSSVKCTTLRLVVGVGEGRKGRAVSSSVTEMPPLSCASCLQVFCTIEIQKKPWAVERCGTCVFWKEE